MKNASNGMVIFQDSRKTDAPGKQDVREEQKAQIEGKKPRGGQKLTWLKLVEFKMREN